MSDIIIPGPKVLLVGGTGTGKTHSLRTLVEAGLKVAAIFTEPGMESISDISCEQGFHWHYIRPATSSWDDLRSSANKINTMSFQALANLPDIDKTKYKEFLSLYDSCANFRCARCGQEFGPVDQLDDEWAFVLDSLSGVNIMAMNLVVGSKPVKSQPDWSMAMDNLERFIIKFTTDIRCLAVLMAHLERETDELTGSTTNMASTLGRKLAPRIPRFFSDVIHARREGSKFTWSTMTLNTDLKARNLPIADNISPSFAPIVENWRARNKEATETFKGATE